MDMQTAPAAYDRLREFNEAKACHNNPALLRISRGGSEAHKLV